MRTCRYIDKEKLCKDMLKEYLYTIYKKNEIRNEYGKARINFESRIITEGEYENEKRKSII